MWVSRRGRWQPCLLRLAENLDDAVQRGHIGGLEFAAFPVDDEILGTFQNGCYGFLVKRPNVMYISAAMICLALLILPGKVMPTTKTPALAGKVALVTGGARNKEIATAVRFLCSSDASYITGQTIHINGGQMMF